MMAAFDQPFHGIRFGVPDDSYYETQDVSSWGINPFYTNDRNPVGQSQIWLQVSLRKCPPFPRRATLNVVQSHFGQGLCGAWTGVLRTSTP